MQSIEWCNPLSGNHTNFASCCDGDILALRREFCCIRRTHRRPGGNGYGGSSKAHMHWRANHLAVEHGVEAAEQVVGVSPPTVPVWAASGDTPKTYTTTEDQCRECETRKSLLV